MGNGVWPINVLDEDQLIDVLGGVAGSSIPWICGLHGTRFA